MKEVEYTLREIKKNSYNLNLRHNLTTNNYKDLTSSLELFI